MAYITSTLTTPVEYTLYKDLPGKARAVAASVRINGGANVADKRTIVTPQGVCTQVTDEQLELLRKHPLFKEHEKKGYVAVVETRYKEDAEKAAKDLQPKDGSAPKTPQDYEEKKAKKPKVKK